MAASDLDQDLQAFIEGSIPSVWALELLVHLRAEPRASRSAEALVAELRASAPLVDDILNTLVTAGLVVGGEDGFRYAPASATLDRLCAALEAAYRERPVRVVNAITARRADPLKGFADSFRLRGWKP